MTHQAQPLPGVRRRAGVATLLLAATVALAACSSGPHEPVGAVLGGAAGGLAGSRIGSGSGQLVATGVGAGLGALLGAEAGRDIDRAADARHGALTPRRAYRTHAHAPRHAYGPRARPVAWTYDTRPAARPVADVHRQVAIPGARQKDDFHFWDFLTPREPIVAPQVQQAAAPAADASCTRSDAPTLKPVYVCRTGGATYVRQ